MSREYTEEEIREQFLDHLRMLVDYWDKVKDKTKKEALQGICHSILACIDGCAGDMPGFILAPITHESDKEYNISIGDNYYCENHNSNVKCDIAGYLHELFHKKD